MAIKTIIPWGLAFDKLRAELHPGQEDRRYPRTTRRAFAQEQESEARENLRNRCETCLINVHSRVPFKL